MDNRSKLAEILADPLQFARFCWPDVTFYRKQVALVESFAKNDETYAPAGNMLGKDFISGFLIVWFFVSRHPCRIITTSAKEDHLRVLWGEVKRFISTSRFPLDAKSGGPLLVFHREIRRTINGEPDNISYVRGMVAGDEAAAAMQGHHVAKTGDGLPRTAFFGDEASSLSDVYYQMCSTWADRKLILGNTWPCDNFFKYAVKGKPGTDDKGGDIPDPNEPGRFLRKIIQIKATDSPNVMLGIQQAAKGLKPTGEIIIPGVLPYTDYAKRRLMWDKVQQTVSLDAEFYEGADELMFPPHWLEQAHIVAEGLPSLELRKAAAMGIDPAEGGDKTAWTIVDEYGIMVQLALQTPDTNFIVGKTVELIREFHIPPEKVAFDRGGGGKQHADRMRAMGYPVQTVAFGETLSLDVKRFIQIQERKEHREEHYVYCNRRAEMYGMLRELLDPVNNLQGFGIPRDLTELRRQLAPIPFRYDAEGRLKLPPKNRKSPDSDEVTLTSLIGCSPDEADSLVLAIFAMKKKAVRSIAGQRMY